MAWLVEWTQPGQSEYRVSVWASEADAYKGACSDMLAHINDDWDLADSDTEDQARNINDLVAVGSYGPALSEYSDCESERDYEYSQFWNVVERDEQTHPRAPMLLTFQSHCSNCGDDCDDGCSLCDDCAEESMEDEDEDDEEDDEDYVASVPGAKCRGPNCGNHSPDAYADRRDGTYVCYQCKLMSQVFGGTIK